MAGHVGTQDVSFVSSVSHCRQAGRAKVKETLPSVEHGDVVSVKIVLARPHAKYAIGASKEGRLFVVQVTRN